MNFLRIVLDLYKHIFAAFGPTLEIKSMNNTLGIGLLC